MTRFPLVATLLVAGCGTSSPARSFVPEDVPEDIAAEVAADTDLPEVPARDDVPPVRRDATPDMTLAPDAACSSTAVEAVVERRPVDIIWVVDNSISMAPAIEQVIRGLNAFAGLIASRRLDYRVVMLSLRNVQRNVTVPDGARYAVCIPQPLAGDSRCGDGPRFVHSSVDIRSTQPLEQFLGTLGQTGGYLAGQPRGGSPWRPFLRSEATRTVVVVTDDQSRLSADLFDHFAGGVNPNSRTFMLPPGVLEPAWGGLFRDYTFSAIYGWGSDRDPNAVCTYPNGTSPPASGTVYTTLVARTNGVRARICDGAAAWAPFFDQVAMAVARNSRIQCELAIPRAPDGSVLDPRRVNVALRGTTVTLFGRVSNAAACGQRGGWHFDDDARPSRVLLCPASCERANAELRLGSARIEVQFGCISIPG